MKGRSSEDLSIFNCRISRVHYLPICLPFLLILYFMLRLQSNSIRLPPAFFGQFMGICMASIVGISRNRFRDTIFPQNIPYYFFVACFACFMFAVGANNWKMYPLTFVILFLLVLVSFLLPCSGEDNEFGDVVDISIVNFLISGALSIFSIGVIWKCFAFLMVIKGLM